MASSVVPHRDPSTVVSSTLALPDFGEGQLLVGTSFPQMVVDGPAQMSQSRRPGCVGLYEEGSALAPRLTAGRRGAPIIQRRNRCSMRLFDHGGIRSSTGRQEMAALQAHRSYPGLQHARYVWRNQPGRFRGMADVKCMYRQARGWMEASDRIHANDPVTTHASSPGLECQDQRQDGMSRREDFHHVIVSDAAGRDICRC